MPEKDPGSKGSSWRQVMQTREMGTAENLRFGRGILAFL